MWFVYIVGVLGLQLGIYCFDGIQLVGWGIGLVFEVYDVFKVLCNVVDVFVDFCECVFVLFVVLLDMVVGSNVGIGLECVCGVLDFGVVLVKFLVICEVQGGFCELLWVVFIVDVLVFVLGCIVVIDNCRLVKLVKLVGVLIFFIVGFEIGLWIGDMVECGQFMMILYVELLGELVYVLEYVVML